MIPIFNEAINRGQWASGPPVGTNCQRVSFAESFVGVFCVIDHQWLLTTADVRGKEFRLPRGEAWKGCMEQGRI